VPESSAAAALVGLSLGCILFGLAWASFLIWFGAAVLLASLGRLTNELRAERSSRRRAADGATVSAAGEDRGIDAHRPMSAVPGQGRSTGAGGGPGT